MKRHHRKSVALFFAAVSLCILPLIGSDGSRSAEAADKQDAGTRIVMSLDNVLDKLERAPTLFDHERHVGALKEKGCRVCHEPNEQGKVTYEFCVWDESADRRAIIDANHDKCMGCHGGVAEGGEKAEELTCGECHAEKIGYKTFKWYRATFNHVDHIDLLEKGCDTCHHTYDEQAGKLTYEKGDEAACGSCHKQEDEGQAAALRKVGHTQCIGCHEEKYPEVKAEADPYACDSCHRPEEKPTEMELITLAEVPYKKRPEKLLISYPNSIMPAVPFNHTKHVPEEQEGCAKTCHGFHARTLARLDTRFVRTGEACQQCHMLTGVKIMTDGIEAEKIYHNPESANSCRGCHIEENKKIKQGEEQPPVTCRGCHSGTLPEEALITPATEEAGEAVLPELPETYIIGRLSQKRLPVKFAHSRHAKMVDNCSACHHKSPETERPPCYTCHGESADFSKKSKVKMVSAYHRMCIGCHREVGDGPITCNKCHEEKETIHSSDQSLQMSEEMIAPEQQMSEEMVAPEQEEAPAL